MMAKLVRAAAVALLVLVMAVTPLSGFLSGGIFETRLPGWVGVHATRVVLEDHTGFVKGIAPWNDWDSLDDGVKSLDANRLIIQWMGGCGDSLTTLTVDRRDAGFRVTERTTHHCSLLMGIGRAVVVALWSPVDASLVDFVSHD